MPSLAAWLADHWLVLTLLTAYIGVMVWHAIQGKRGTKGVSDYYVGGRTMGGIALGVSFFATYSSTNSFVGFSGQAYSYGVGWLLIMPAAVVFSIIAWVGVAPRLRDFTGSLDSLTLPDFIGFRFDSYGARFSAALIVIFASLLYMTAVFKGAGNLLETFLDIPYAAAIALVLVIVMVYTAVGGFISVVKTDVVQGTIMAVAAVFLFAGTLRAAGGWGALDAVRAMPEGEPLFRLDTAMPFAVLLGIVVAGTFKLIVEPRQLSRFYALEDRHAARRGMWVSTGLFLLVYTLLVPIGLFARNVFPTGIEDTDLVVPQLLSGAAFPSAIAAFLVLAMVAAAMSSLDSVLLVLASTVERDVVGLVLPQRSEGTQLNATKLYVAGFAILTAIIALNPPGGIVALTSFSGSLYAACFLPAIALGLYWRRGGGGAVLASFAMGVGTLALWRFVPGGGGIHPVFPAMVLSMVAYVGVALTEPPTPPAHVGQIFDRLATPVPTPRDGTAAKVPA